MLDIKRLRYLEAIYRYKSFTRASEELFVSQPAISAAVNAMEKELGCKLIIRSSKKVTFTFEGEQFMRYANHILKECNEAEEMMADFSENSHRILRLGVSPTLALRLLPHLYSDFFPRYPNATIHLDEGSMLNHIEKIQDDVLDLSYNALPSQPNLSVLNLIPVTTAQLYMILNPHHPLTKYDAIPIEALEGVPLCMLDTKSRIRALMLENFEKKGIVPNIVSYHEQIMCMFHMVKFGSYVGFINAESGCTNFAFADTELVVRPFAEPILFEAGFITKTNKHLPKLARELIAFAQNTKSVWNEQP